MELSRNTRENIFSARYVTGMTVLGLGFGAIVGLAADNLHRPNTRIDGSKYYEEDYNYYAGTIIPEYKANVEEAERLSIALPEQLGESCMQLLSRYSVGGDLSEVSEDGAVVDIINTPKEPCGDAPADARSALRTIREYKEIDINYTAEGYNSVLDKAKKIEAGLEKDMQEDENLPLYLVAGALFGTHNLISSIASEKKFRSDNNIYFSSYICSLERPFYRKRLPKYKHISLFTRAIRKVLG